VLDQPADLVSQVMQHLFGPNSVAEMPFSQFLLPIQAQLNKATGRFEPMVHMDGEHQVLQCMHVFAHV
jgi:hypothetical protein